MSKVHPRDQESSTTAAVCPPINCSGRCSRDEGGGGGVQEYTIWMKSLILGGKGCTVYDSKGQLVYRVDNYHSKSTTELFLMDTCGKLLCTLLRKKCIFKLCGGVWEGYRSSCTTSAGPWFRVRRPALTLFSSSCEVLMVDGADDETLGARPFRIQKSTSTSSACTIVIVDARGGVLAEVKRKQTAQGVVLGQDVSTMTLHPNVDPSLIISLLLSYPLLSSHL